MIIIQTIMDSINISKEYLNFSSAHFLVFNEKKREHLHGHNYRVRFSGSVENLKDDMVFDFLKIKPLIKKICDSLDGKVIIAKENPHLSITTNDEYAEISLVGNYLFKLPLDDILFLPIKNSSSELLARYISNSIREILIENYQFKFQKTTVEVEETKGQSAVYEQEEV